MCVCVHTQHTHNIFIIFSSIHVYFLLVASLSFQSAYWRLKSSVGFYLSTNLTVCKSLVIDFLGFEVVFLLRILLYVYYTYTHTHTFLHTAYTHTHTHVVGAYCTVAEWMRAWAEHLWGCLGSERVQGGGKTTLGQDHHSSREEQSGCVPRQEAGMRGWYVLSGSDCRGPGESEHFRSVHQERMHCDSCCC